MSPQYVYVVVSVWHGQGRDRTFLHGVFLDQVEAEFVSHKVVDDHQYVADEGYALEKTTAHSTYIAALPLNTHVNDFVPTVV